MLTCRQPSKLSQEFIRANVAWTQFPFLSKSHNSFPWRYPKKHIVPFMEFQIFLYFIRITFLSSLSCSHSILNNLHFFSGDFNQFWTLYLPFTNFTPTYGCTTPSTIQRLIWCHINNRLETIDIWNFILSKANIHPNFLFFINLITPFHGDIRRNT